jgi:hypothetical protein
MMLDPDIWNSEAHKALEMEIIEQRDREIRNTRNANRVPTDRERLGCTCGSCNVINVRSFSGAVVTTMLDGPCGAAKPRPAPKRLRVIDAAGKPAGTVMSQRGWMPPAEVNLDPIYERPELEVEFWRSLVFGWHGQLVRGTVTLDQWWRPFRSWAEYRGSFVMLRWIEHDERTTMDLAGY